MESEREVGSMGESGGQSERDKAQTTLENEDGSAIVVAVEGAKTLANTLVLELEELEVVAAVAGDSPIGFSGNSVR